MPVTTSRHGARRAIAALAVVALACAPAAASAAPRAAVTATASASTRVTFGIQPATATAPDPTRGLLTYSATAGAHLLDHVAVFNYSTAPVTLTLAAADAFTTDGGGYDVLTSTHRSTDLGSWIHLDRGRLTLPARSHVVLPVRLVIPPDATPGDHSAGVVVSSQVRPVGAGSRVAFEERVGVRVYLRVTGRLRPHLTVSALHADYDSSGLVSPRGTVTVTYVLHNDGNVRLAATQAVRLSGLRLDRLTRPGALTDLLPGASVPVHARFRDVATVGRASAEVLVTPTAQTDEPVGHLELVRARTTIWIHGWLVAVVVALAFGASALVGHILGRRRRRRAIPPPPAPSANRTPVGSAA